MILILLQNKNAAAKSFYSSILLNADSPFLNQRKFLHTNSANQQRQEDNDDKNKNNKDDDKNMQPLTSKFALLMLISYVFALILLSTTNEGGREVK